MGEALTPHLTREQYIRGYIDALRLEEQNINYNYEANDQYGKTGETLGVALDASETVLGLPKATLLPATAVKFKDEIDNPFAALKGLNTEELAFANAAAEQLKPIMKDNFGSPMQAFLFRGFLKQELVNAKAERNVAPYIKSIVPQAPPDAGVPPANQDPLATPATQAANDQLNQAYSGGGQPAQTPEGNSQNKQQTGNNNNNVIKKTINNLKKGGKGRGIGGGGISTGKATYYPLGDHYINIDHLNDGIVNIKKHNLKSSKLPKKKVGGSVGKVLKSVLQGQSPSLHDMEKMDDDERGYINQLGKITGEGKLSMPLRDLTSEEKMEQEFEILKGQIIAGNDNEKLVKDFKLMLMRLMKNGRIPKKEGQDILLDLATLGY